jgi:tetratricopeptide (TPR) repeat protein
MDRKIVGKRPNFHPNGRHSSFYRSLFWLSLILAGIWILLSYQRGQIEAPFLPSPTPTRNTQSYLLEAQAYFEAGKLDDPDPPSPTPPHPDAIDMYKLALREDPNNPQVLSELARIQTYSSSMLRNDTEKLARLNEAVSSADKAVQLAPDDSQVHAIRAFVLDWYSSNPLVSDNERERALNDANSEANRAFQLDPNNALALAYYAEILTDQQKWSQALTYARKAVDLDPNSMDTHRVLGYVYENRGDYNFAIREYQAATQINPNITFLYVLIGRLYREGIKNPDLALENFAQAANINKTLNVQNPVPYVEIARTYSQQGQFFAAARNAEQALRLDPGNSSTYGQLGIIFIQARNYEGAMTLLKCTVEGCTAEENGVCTVVNCTTGSADQLKVAVEKLPLTNLTVAYYYVEYGTVMAFLSRPYEDFCPQAIPVLNQVISSYPKDPILNGIVQDSLGICRNLANSVSANQATSPAAGATSGPETAPGLGTGTPPAPLQATEPMTAEPPTATP